MNQLELYLAWYKNQSVRFEIVKSLYRREFTLFSKHTPKSNIRHLKAHSVKNFDFVMWKLLHIDTKKTLFSLYYSLAQYQNGVPNAPATLSEWRSSEKWKNTKILWQREHYIRMISYDFALDIDAGDHTELPYAKDSAIAIMGYFDELNVPYEVRFSGKGFHFIIPYKFFLDIDFFSFNPNYDNYEKGTIYKLYQQIAVYLYNKFSEMVDYDIYDSRRVLKIPYSLALYPTDENCYICFPFHTRAGLRGFELEQCILCEDNSAVHLDMIKKRGLHLFNPDGNVEKLLEDLR